MGRYGQAILTIGGTIIGAYFGYPQLGAVLGSLAGSLLFPTQLPTVNGPKLNDITQTTSSVGTPIPRGWGVFPASGAIIAQSDLREVTDSDEVGGKGGPTQTVNTTNYFQDFAIGLNGSNLFGKGTIGGVRTIWANGKAIYDRRPKRTAESDADFQARMVASDKLEDTFTLYLGTEDQEPDPTLEAFYGVGNISAFRGLAYIVFINWQNKPEDGSRMPANWKFEVYSAGADDITTATEYSNEVLYDWHSLTNNPTSFNNRNVFSVESGDSTLVTEDFEEVIEAIRSNRGWDSVVCLGAFNPPGAEGWGIFSMNTTGGEPFIDQAGFRAQVVFGPEDPDIYIQFDPIADLCAGSNPKRVIPYTPGKIYATDLGEEFRTTGVPATVNSPGPTPRHPYTQITHCEDGFWYEYEAISQVQVDRNPAAPADPCDGKPDLGELPGYCVASDGRLTKAGAWTFDNSHDWLVLQLFRPGSTDADPTWYPLNPARPYTHPDNTEAFWTAAYDAAVAAGTSPPGKTYDPTGDGDGLIHYPCRQGFGYYRTQDSRVINTDTYPVANIVRDLCEEAGLNPATDVDVTDLESIETIGYVRTRMMTVRAALDPLRQAFQFDGIESAGTAKFIRRGGPIQLTLTDDDLGVHIEGEEAPSKVTTATAQDVDLPRSVRVHYLSPARDYEPGDQQSPSRLETEAVNDLDLELPIVLTDDQALQISQILWADAWAGRWSHQIAIDAQHQELEPTDIIAVPVDGVLQRTRISAFTDQVPMVRKAELVRDDDASWVSTAVASVPPFIPPPIAFAGPVEAVLMDLPALSDSHDDPGFYAAVRPLLGGAWRGAALYRSVDGGGSFQIIGQFGSPISAAGKLLANAPEGPTDIWDEESAITVDLLYGALENRTAEAVQAGANAAAIGAHGHWEIVQFRDVELVSGTTYKLTGLLRGRRGTERYVGLALRGEDFVLLSDAGVIRIPLEQSQIGAVYQYRAVGTGGNLSAALTSDFEGDGEALRPFSPVNLRVATDFQTGDQRISWIRRGRLGQEMPSGADIPVSEASELYDVEIADTAGTVVRTMQVTAPQYTYAQADQEGDFGLSSAYRVTVYQVSAILGRGPGISIDTETAPSVLPVIVYPTINLQIDFGGAPDGNEDVYVRIDFTRLDGTTETFTTVLLGSGKDSPDDYATDLLAQLEGFGDWVGEVTFSQSSINNVILTTRQGSWFASNIIPVWPVGTTQVLREPLPAQVSVFQQIAFDLFTTTGGFIVSAPDQSNAYRNGGAAVANFTIDGLTWEKQEELNYGINRQINWAAPNAISDQKHVATGGALDALRLPALAPYIRNASYNVVGSITVINVVMQEGYRIVENWLQLSGTGTHPSGYKPAFEQNVAGVPSYPTGAKKMVYAYFSPQYGTIPIGYMTAGTDLKITLDGVDYTHTLSSDEADAFNDPGGASIDPAVVAFRNGALDVLEAAIEGSGNFNVYHELYSNGIYKNWRIERTLADIDFTIALAVTGYDLTVTTSTFEG